MVAPRGEALYFACLMIRKLLIGLVQLYRYTLSPFLSFLGGPGSGCRFTPTCSEYTLEALREHGALKGCQLGLRRICRCHPWGGFGFDPVPKPSPSSPAQKLSCLPSSGTIKNH